MQKSKLKIIVKQSLKEDVGGGDVTTLATVPAKAKAMAKIVAKEAGVVAGGWVAGEVFHQVDKRIRFVLKVKDGTKVKKGTIIAALTGPARGILTGERVALNFLQRLSGIATLTAKFKAQISKLKTDVKLLDTRKTTPGLRELEKYAVKCGGGVNHRMGLYDAVLIKENHIAIAGGIGRAVDRVKGQGARVKKIEVEARDLAEVKEAIEAGVDRILLDNMDIKTLREAVRLCKKARIKTEA